MLPTLPLLMAATLLGGSDADQGRPRFAPDLELPTIDGDRTIRLMQLRGRKLLLIEFASW